MTLALEQCDCEAAAFDQADEHIRTGRRRILIVAPTDGGETVFALAVMDMVNTKGNDTRGRETEAISSYMDGDAWHHARLNEAAERESMQAFNDQWSRRLLVVGQTGSGKDRR